MICYFNILVSSSGKTQKLDYENVYVLTIIDEYTKVYVIIFTVIALETNDRIKTSHESQKILINKA